MSLFQVQRVMYASKRDKALAARLKSSPDATLAEFDLTEAERHALRDGDLAALYRMGVHPLLLAPYSRLLGIARPDYHAALAPLCGERPMRSADDTAIKEI